MQIRATRTYLASSCHDRPNDSSLVDVLKRQRMIKGLKGDEKTRALEALNDEVRNGKIALGTTRVFVGVKDNVAQYALYDKEGKLKVRLSASSDGPGQIEIFDKEGKPITR